MNINPLNLVPRLQPSNKQQNDVAEVIENYKISDCEQYNVLMIGDSRSGKSTFINLLKDINYVTEYVLLAETPIPKTHNLLVEFRDKKMNINLIDTPGLNEMGDTSRSNETINHMISSFVKGDVTKLHLILIAINVMDSNKIKSLEEIIRLLGSHLTKNMVLLVTHFEGKNYQEEDNWKKQFNEQKAFQFIKTACKGGVIFTGAISKTNYADAKHRDSFIISQKVRIIKFLNLLSSTEPGQLSKQIHSKAQSKFHVQESFLSNYQSFKMLCPEVKSLSDQIVLSRTKLRQMEIPEEYKSQVDDIFKQADIVGTNDVRLPKFDVGMEASVNQYEKLRSEMERELREAQILNDQLSNILNDINRMIGMIEFHE
jgi:predicted GTPase